MTALVTALGLLPLALGIAEPGREIEGPMATVIVGGLMTSTLLNLLVLPTLPAVRQVRRRQRPRRRRTGRAAKLAASPRRSRLQLLGSDAHRVRLLEQPLAHEIYMHPQMVELI